MFKGNRESLSCLLSLGGYGASVPVALVGSVVEGLGDVRAKTRADETASAYVLNSEVGVT